VLCKRDILSARSGASVLAQLFQNLDRESRDSDDQEIEGLKDRYNDITTIPWNCYPELNLKS
jgi:hypothetical protein